MLKIETKKEFTMDGKARERLNSTLLELYEFYKDFKDNNINKFMSNYGISIDKHKLEITITCLETLVSQEIMLFYDKD